MSFRKIKYCFINFLISLFVFATVISCSNGSNGTDVHTEANDYAFSKPTIISVEPSTSKANTVTVSWNALENDEVTYYWIYYSTTNDTSSFTRPDAAAHAGLYVTKGIGKYDITLSENGTYYFWIKAANGISTSDATKFSDFSNTISYSFTHTALITPTNVSVSASTKRANTVTVSWTASDAAYYWIYYSTSNDTSALTRPQENVHAGLYVTKGIGSYDIVIEESGEYYFWVKAADSYYSSSTNSSDFSTSSTYLFTYSELTTPTNVTAAASNTSGKVTVTWTASDATYYWIYYSTSNDTSQLTRPQADVHAGLYVTNGIGKYDISLTESGTYYIWIKAANQFYSNTGKSSNFSTVTTYTVD